MSVSDGYPTQAVRLPFLAFFSSFFPRPERSSRWTSKMDMSLKKFALLLLLAQISQLQTAVAQSFFPALFTFGDSLVDNGNNNFIASLSRANYPPNGLDYEGLTPTGRFCNGRTISDYIGLLVGLGPTPPYLDFSRSNFSRGANFASGAAGILDESGANFLQRIPMSVQVEYFKDLNRLLRASLGSSQTAELFAKSLVFIVIGSNDYLNNYLLPDSPDSALYSPQEFQRLVLATFSQHLKDIYDTGARNIVVTAIGPLGCMPWLRYRFLKGQGECIEEPVNKLIKGYNVAMKELLTNLTHQLPNATFLYANSYDTTFAYTQNPSYYGFVNGNSSCCGFGLFGAQIECLPTTPYCDNRASHVFWDRYHPSDRTNLLLANAFLHGSQEEISPMNIMELIKSKQKS